jgi:hypothetical protein
MRSWRDWNRIRILNQYCFKEKSRFTKNAFCRQASRAGIWKAAQSSGLGGRGEDEHSIKTGGEGSRFWMTAFPGQTGVTVPINLPLFQTSSKGTGFGE